MPKGRRRARQRTPGMRGRGRCWWSWSRVNTRNLVPMEWELTLDVVEGEPNLESDVKLCV